MDESRIKARVVARERATAIVELMSEEIALRVDLPSQEAFWEVIRKALPLVPRPKSKTLSQAMSDVEAREFGQEVRAYGSFAGKRFDEVSLEELDRYSDNCISIGKQLSRYLASRRIQSEQS
jgi:hypothetical protein